MSNWKSCVATKTNMSWVSMYVVGATTEVVQVTVDGICVFFFCNCQKVGRFWVTNTIQGLRPERVKWAFIRTINEFIWKILSHSIYLRKENLHGFYSIKLIATQTNVAAHYCPIPKVNHDNKKAAVKILLFFHFIKFLHYYFFFNNKRPPTSTTSLLF